VDAHFYARIYITGRIDQRPEADPRVGSEGVVPAGIGINAGIPASDSQVIDEAIQKLIAQDEDMLILVSGLPALRAQQAVTGTDTTRRLFSGHRPRRVRGCGEPISPRGI